MGSCRINVCYLISYIGYRICLGNKLDNLGEQEAGDFGRTPASALIHPPTALDRDAVADVSFDTRIIKVTNNI